MFYIKDAYARLCSLEEKTNKSTGKTRIVGRIYTSELDTNDERRYSNWFATFVGDSKEKIQKIPVTSYINILKGKITNEGKKDEDGNYVNYLNVTVFDVEPKNYSSSEDSDTPDKNKKSAQKQTKKTSVNKKSNSTKESKKEEVEDIPDDELPF